MNNTNHAIAIGTPVRAATTVTHEVHLHSAVRNFRPDGTHANFTYTLQVVRADGGYWAGRHGFIADSAVAHATVLA